MDAGTTLLFPPAAELGEIEDECAATIIDQNELLGWRLGALFGILCVSAIGVTIPYVTRLVSLHKLLFVLKAFAGGVVLATGFVHILQDSVEGLASPCLGWPEYPWAMMLATFASLFTFTFEWYLHKYFTNSFFESQADAEQHSHTSADCSQPRIGAAAAPPTSDYPAPVESTSKVLDDMKVDDLERIMYSVQSCTLEMGIIFHSIFIGISLGLNTDKSSVQSLMVALMFHQFNEGLAIGVTFIQARYSTLRYCLLGASFLLTTPIGVAIGIAVGHGGYSSKALLGTEGVFNAISAGILLYNGMVDLIVPTFSVADARRGPGVQLLGFAALFVGAGIMAAIGVWA